MNPPSPRAGTYVYCVGAARSLGAESAPFAASGIGGPGRPVRAVEHADLAAIVSDALELRPQISRENLAAHQRVLEEAMARTDVLPVSFGTLANSDREVREKLLEREFEELHAWLDRIRGCVELSLRVFWNRERLFAEVVADNAEIGALRDQLAGLPPDANIYDRVHLGQLTEAAINLKRDQEAESMLSALEPLAVEMQLNDTLTETMILNAAFLVERDRLPEFDARVQALGEGQEERLVFRYVGPLPPYSFVNLNVSWED